MVTVHVFDISTVHMSLRLSSKIDLKERCCKQKCRTLAVRIHSIMVAGNNVAAVSVVGIARRNSIPFFY